MSCARLDPRTAARLAKIGALFSSDHAGERAVAAAKFHAVLRNLNLNWEDLLSTGSEQQQGATCGRPHWRQMAVMCQAKAQSLNPREAKFVSDIVQQRRQASDKQLSWLNDIYDRHYRGEAV